MSPTTTTTRESFPVQARRLGAQACAQGKAPHDNPFHMPLFRKAWAEGWATAHAADLKANPEDKHSETIQPKGNP